MARADVYATVGASFVTVSGLKAIYAPAAYGQVVQRIPDSLTVTPCLVLLPGDSPVIPGMWERQTWTVKGSVWLSAANARGEAVETLTNMGDSIIAAMRQPSVPPTSEDTAVQSLVLTSLDAILQDQWKVGSEMPWYLVLPFTLEMKVNRAVTYGPV